MQELLNYVPEVVVVGDIEFAVIGAAMALGFPKLAIKLLEKRTGTDLDGDGEVGPQADEVAEEDAKE